MTLAFNIEINYITNIWKKDHFLFRLKEILFRTGKRFKEFLKNEMFRDVSHASFKVGDERLKDPTLYLYQGNPSLIKHVHV